MSQLPLRGGLHCPHWGEGGIMSCSQLPREGKELHGGIIYPNSPRSELLRAYSKECEIQSQLEMPPWPLKFYNNKSP